MSIDYSKPVTITLPDRAAYGLFLLFELVLRLFPLAFWCLLGRTVGWIAWLILPRYRRLVRRNMKIIFGGSKNDRELHALVKENFQTIICNFIASAKAATMSDRSLNKHFVIKGKENVLSSLGNKGNGVICAIPHMGNWELLSRIRIHFKEVGRFASFYRELDNPLMERLWLKRREKSGCEMFGKKTSSFINATKVLRDNGMLGILCDQNAGNYGVLVPYFGKQASTTNLPALIQRRAQADILPVTVHTIGLARWEVAFGPAIDLIGPSKSGADTTARINEKLSAIGRQFPADGFWLHNRWKQATLLPQGRPVEPLPSPYGKPFLPLRLLAVMPDELGEALLFIPAMKAISSARSDCEWSVLCHAHQKEFWDMEPYIVQTVAKQDSSEKLLEELEENGPVGLDIAYILDRDKKTVSILKKLGVAVRAMEGEHPLLKHWRDTVKQPPVKGHRALDFGQFPSASMITPGVEAYFPERHPPSTQGKSPVFFAPFTSLSRTNEWKEGFWARLIKKLPFPLTLIALEKDRQRAEKWARDLAVESRIISLGKMTEELKKGHLLIAVDGEFPALAAYSGIPTVTLFVERNPETWAPLGDFHECIRAGSTNLVEEFSEKVRESILRII